MIRLLVLASAIAITSTAQVSQADVYSQIVPNANDRFLVMWGCQTNSSQTNPSFADQNCFGINETVTNGLALYGSSTQAKKTFIADSVTVNAIGSGQRIARSTTVNCYTTESDCAAHSINVTFASVPIAGDEGAGFSVINYLHQPSALALTTIGSVPTQNTYSTTLTQAVTKAIGAQTVTVASTSGCMASSSPGDSNGWVVIAQEAATGQPQEFPVQITTCGSGSITGIFVGNASNGATVTPAEVVNVTSNAGMGQGGRLVNHTQASYSTGTVASISVATISGSGTSWSSGMVGGSSLVPGCFTLTGDNNSAAPFNGSGTTGTLKTWYPITGVSGSSALSILSYTTSGDGTYRSVYGTMGGAYTVSPCAKILYMSGTMLVLESNSFTWAASDSAEAAIGAYPDVTGYQDEVAVYTAGGIRRAWTSVTNIGTSAFNIGLNITGNMPSGSANLYAWFQGTYLDKTYYGNWVNECQSGNCFIANATSTTTNSQTPGYAFYGMNIFNSSGGTLGTGLFANGSTGLMFFGYGGDVLTVPQISGSATLAAITSSSPPTNSTACFKANGTLGYLVGATCT